MATTYYNKTKHDLGVVDPQTPYDVVGMMLAKVPTAEKGKVPAWSEYDDQYLAQQFFTGQPSYVNTPPERRLIHDKKNWRAGFGKKYQDDSEPSRYFASYGMDLSYEGMAVPGAIASTITKPVAFNPTVVNAAFTLETGWTDLTSYVGSGGQSGAYGLISGDNQTKEAYQDATSYVPGSEYTFTCYIKWITHASATYQAKIGINDGVNTTYSSLSSEVTWTQLTVTKTISAAATRLRLLLWFTCDAGSSSCGYDTSTTVMSTLPTLGTVASHAYFNSIEYASFGTVLAKLTSTTAFTAVAILPASITCLEVFTDSKLYIALGHSNNYWEMTTAEAFTQNTLAVNKFKFFKTVFTTAPTMYGNDTDYTVRANTDPSQGGANPWGDPTTICSSDQDITQLMSESGALYVMTTNIPYYLSGVTVKNDLAPELAAIAASTSGKNSTFFNSFYYIPAGTQTLLETDGTTNTYRNPSSYSMDLSAFVGRVQATTHDEQWLFAIVDNSGTLEILKGGNAIVDGVSQWVWHPFCEITLTDCETAWVSTAYQKRLWISSTTAAEGLYYIPLPTGYGNVSADTNRTFKTDTYFEDTFIDHNFRSDKKAFNKITATLGHTYSANIYYECWYKKLEDADWTDAGDFKGTATDRRPVLYIPADGSGYNPTSTMMQFKFVAKTNSTTTAPILLNYTVESILYPPIGKIYAAKVSMGENVVDRQGMPDPNMYTKIKTTLDNAVSATYPVTIYDLDGTSRTVKFLSLPADVKRREVISYEEGRPIEWVYNILMQVVTVSSVGISASTEAGYKIPRTATIVVAASDALARSKVQADYTCDGTADEVQINAAIAALPSVGGSISLSEGTFYLAGEAVLVSKMKLFGTGRMSTILRNAVGYTGNLISGSSVYEVDISDLYVYGASIGAVGVYFIDSRDIHLTRVRASYCLSHGIHFDNTAVNLTYNITLDNCYTAYNEGDGIRVYGVGSSPMVRLNWCTTGANTGAGIRLSCGHFSINDPWVEANIGPGLYLIGGGYVHGGLCTGVATSDDGIYAYGGGTGSTKPIVLDNIRMGGGGAYNIHAHTNKNLHLLNINIPEGAALGSIYLETACDDTVLDGIVTLSTAAGKKSLHIAHSSCDRTAINGNCSFDSTVTDSGLLTYYFYGDKYALTALSAVVGNRGRFYFTESAGGVADKVYCIMKSAADTYSAVEVATG